MHEAGQNAGATARSREQQQLLNVRNKTRLLFLFARFSSVVGSRVRGGFGSNFKLEIQSIAVICFAGVSRQFVLRDLIDL